MFKRIRHWRFRQRLRRYHQKPSVAGIITLLSCFPSHCSFNYSPYVGSAVPLYVRYNNIELLINKLNLLTRTIEEAGYVRFNIQEEPIVETTLDDYLIDGQEEPVAPEELLDVLIEEYDALYNEISVVKTAKQGYYARQSLPLLDETAEVIEALWFFVP